MTSSSAMARAVERGAGLRAAPDQRPRGLAGGTIGLDDLRRADVVTDQMGPRLPGPDRAPGADPGDCRGQEQRFSRPSSAGLEALRRKLQRGRDSGEDAFLLQDTYGFPLELTRELAIERGIAIDEETFTRLMSEQRERSRAGAGRAEAQGRRVRAEGGLPAEFVGYEKTEVLTQIGALEELGEGTSSRLRESPSIRRAAARSPMPGHRTRVDRCPCRARRGVSDRRGPGPPLPRRGLRGGDRVKGGHPGSCASHDGEPHGHAPPAPGAARRPRRPRAQAGSAVRPDKLRFDFTHGQALTIEEREAVKRIVNERSSRTSPVHALVTPIDEARNLGA